MCEDSKDGLENDVEFKICNDAESLLLSISSCPVYNISFGDEHGEVGRLTFSDNQIHFTGKADEAAKQFFDYLKQYVDGYIKEKLDNLRKYGKHLRSCELVKQPFLSGTNSNWSCTCGFSEAMNCELCGKKGYVVSLPMPKGGYLTGHCPECGNI